jgi:hypothetical protein
LKAIIRALVLLAILISIVLIPAHARAQYVPLPPTPGLTGPQLRQAIDERFNGTVQISPNAPNVTVATATLTSGTLTLTLPTHGHSLQNLTIAGTGAILIPAGNWLGQSAVLNICQNSTGGFLATVQGASTITIKGSFPTWTLTPNLCDICGLIYTTASTWVITGCKQNLS